MGETTVFRIIKEMCSAIQEIVMPIYLPVITRDLSEKTAAGILSNWQMPNFVGVLDGKHINIFTPKNTASLYYNYKKQYSLILMALVGASYKYLMIDVGSYEVIVMEYLQTVRLVKLGCKIAAVFRYPRIGDYQILEAT
jgi:hypothetical protein